MSEWISIEDKLPLEEYMHEIDEDKNEIVSVFGEYLVTVWPKDPDEHDEGEVMLLYFSTRNGYFSKNLSTPFESGHSWRVTHWMEKPEPAERKTK